MSLFSQWYEYIYSRLMLQNLQKAGSKLSCLSTILHPFLCFSQERHYAQSGMSKTRLKAGCVFSLLFLRATLGSASHMCVPHKYGYGPLQLLGVIVMFGMWTRKHLFQIRCWQRGDHNNYCQCSKAKQKLCHKYIQDMTVENRRERHMLSYSKFTVLFLCILFSFILCCRAMSTLWGQPFLPRWTSSSSPSWRSSWEKKSRSCWSRCRRRNLRTGLCSRY